MARLVRNIITNKRTFKPQSLASAFESWLAKLLGFGFGIEHTAIRTVWAAFLGRQRWQLSACPAKYFSFVNHPRGRGCTARDHMYGQAVWMKLQALCKQDFLHA